MTPHALSPARPTLRRLSLIALLSLLATFFWCAAPALAHEGLVAGTPKQDSTLDTAPAEMRLEFTGPLQQMEISASNQIQVVDEEGRSVVQGETKVEDQYLIADLNIEANGTYTTSWVALSGDGHQVRNDGPYTFTVNDPALDQAAADASPSPTPSAAPSEAPSETPAADAAETSETPTEHSFWSPGLIGLTMVVLVAVIISAVILARTRRKARNEGTRE